jgi:hypothetical protein
MLRAKDVVAVERYFISVLEHSPGTKSQKQEYFHSRGIRVPKTSYESMWQALTERLHRSGAASAVFEYLRGHMPNRLKELLQQTRRGRPVRIRANEPVIIGDFFFQNGNLRRIGQLYLDNLYSQGGRLVKGASMPRPVKSRKPYEVALSFAGEDRPFVEAVAEELRSMGVRLFYDTFEEVNLFGKDLAAHFGQIYRHRADYCAIFISAYYASKAWPQLERQHAQARALAERREYILPIRLDDTEVPGLSPTIGYVDARNKTPHAIANILFQKIRA